MTRKRQLIRRACLLFAAGSTTPALARPELIPSVTASVGASYSTNPFLQIGDTQNGAAISADVTPALEIIDDRTDAVLSATIGRTQYFEGDSDNTWYRAQGVLSHRATDRLTLTAQLGFDSGILGARPATTLSGFIPSDRGTETTSATTTAADTGAAGRVANPQGFLVGPPGLEQATAFGPALIDSDLGLLGTRQRRNLLTGAAGLDFRVSARSTWSLGVNSSRANYPGDALQLNDYTSIGAVFAYTRSLSETRSLGIGLSASTIDYAQTGGTTIVTPRVSYTQRFRGGYTATGNLGAAFVSQDNRSATSLSADASLCRLMVRGLLCASASYQPSISGLGNVRSQTSLNVSYRYQLSENTAIAASAGYSRLPGQSVLMPSMAIDRLTQSFLTSELVLNRRISRRLSGYAGVSYRNLSTSALDIPADYGVRAGLAITLGRQR